MKKLNRLAPVLTILLVFTFLSSTVSSQVVAVGWDSTTQANWRNASVVKPFDPDGDNIYGSDGFILMEWERANWSWGARNTTFDYVLMPAYIASVTDDYANAYRNDTNYGQMNYPLLGSAGTANHAGTVASGNAWNFNHIVIQRNGSTGPFTVTFVTTYYEPTFSGNEHEHQVWVHLGTDQGSAVGVTLTTSLQGTHYAVFNIPAGSEDITIREYSRANHCSAILFDGLAPQSPPYPSEFMFADFESGTVFGGNIFDASGVSVSVPYISSVDPYQGSYSVAYDFNTGDANAEWGSVETWLAWKSIPINMQSFHFAAKMPAGTLFHISIQDDDWGSHTAPWWGIHHSPWFTHTLHNQWELYEFNLVDAMEPIYLDSINANLGTVRVYFHGAANGGPQGLVGTAFFDVFRFSETLDVNNWDLY